MRTCSLVALLLLSLLMTSCGRTDSRLAFSAHSKGTLPASAKLIRNGGQYAGFDASYGFVFDVSDNALLEQLCAEWKLKPATVTESGFFRFAKQEWWPSDDAFRKMDENFGRTDDQNEEYWHVWHDRVNGKLYVEHGRW